MIKTHEEKAISIAREAVIEQTPLAKCSARQGDVVLVRVGDPGRGNYDSTPVGGIQLAAGQHGEHRLISSACRWDEPGIIELKEEGLLVHTDVPEARHGSIRLAPGRWEHRSLRELGADQVVQEVAD
jgi:hypothetical protein